MTENMLHTELGEIHYWRNADDAAKTTLVFLPGLTADHRLLKHQIEHVANGTCSCGKAKKCIDFGNE